MLLRRISLCVAFAATLVHSQTLAGPTLRKALQEGGHVILMRHAQAPGSIPPKGLANPDNNPPERQLDATGRATATAMGQTFRELGIPVGPILTSPTYRANETVRFAQFANPKQTPELSENAADPQHATPAQTTWLKQRVTQFTPGTNTLLVTHSPNVAAAFPGANVEQGEALIFGPDGKGGAVLLARMKIGDWPSLKP